MITGASGLLKNCFGLGGFTKAQNAIKEIIIVQFWTVWIYICVCV